MSPTVKRNSIRIETMTRVDHDPADGELIAAGRRQGDAVVSAVRVEWVWMRDDWYIQTVTASLRDRLKDGEGLGASYDRRQYGDPLPSGKRSYGALQGLVDASRPTERVDVREARS